MKPPVILFDPTVSPEITKSPADYYRNIFSPGVVEEADSSTNGIEQPKPGSSKP